VVKHYCSQVEEVDDCYSELCNVLRIHEN
jgi:hypothetical protein